MKTNVKYILSAMIGLGLMFIVQSCGDSLGIEDNYSKKLISGKDIKDLSYKEFVKITRDTLIFYSDTTIHVDTVHYPVYDTVNEANKYPTRGLVFEPFAIAYSKSYQFLDYPIKSPQSYIISVEYINDTPILNIELEMSFDVNLYSPVFKYAKDIPKSLSVAVRGVTLIPNLIYNLSGDIGSGAFGKIEMLSDNGNRLSYEGINSNMTFYLDKVVLDPTDQKKVLYLRGIIDYKSRDYGINLYTQVNIFLY